MVHLNTFKVFIVPECVKLAIPQEKCFSKPLDDKVQVKTLNFDVNVLFFLWNVKNRQTCSDDRNVFVIMYITKYTNIEVLEDF